MRWAINSSRPALASELSDVLTSEIKQYEKHLDLKLARNMVAAMEAEARGLAPEPEQDSPTRRSPLHARVLVQMSTGILAAVAVARSLGDETTLFLATISGHYDPSHREGIEERMMVSVDIARPTPVPTEE